MNVSKEIPTIYRLLRFDHLIRIDKVRTMNYSKLLSWSQKEFSDIPWRKNRSLYRTLVSEIMLQQTTVGTVKNHFERFLNIYPDLESLARSSEEDLLVAWKGLGYYRRARNLKKIAEALAKDHGGEFPSDIESLQKISGIGPYTANALVGIGMDKRALAIDANLERVIARLFGLKIPKGLKLQKEITRLFEEKEIFATKVSFRALNEALMDLGRTYCQARKANCDLCPMKADCKAFASKKPLSFPVEGKEKKPEKHELHLLRVYVVKKDKVLVYEKEEKEWLSGQFEVPTFILETTDEKLQQYPRHKFTKSPNAQFKSGITKYSINNSLWIISEAEWKSFKFKRPVEWRSLNDEKSNLSTATIKGLKKLGYL